MMLMKLFFYFILKVDAKYGCALCRLPVQMDLHIVPAQKFVQKKVLIPIHTPPIFFFETILKRKSTHTHSHVHMRMLTYSHTRWFTLKAHLYFENIQIEFFHIQFITLITFDHLTCMIFSLRNCVCAALAVNWCFNVAISPHISAHHVRHS